MKHLALLGILLPIFTTIAIAQTTSTEVLGTVRDSSGAVVPNARVTLWRVATGERRLTETTSTGGYAFPLIEVGEYTVAVEVSGFKRQERKGILLHIQDRARVDFALEIGEVSETVQVEGRAVALKTDEAAIGQVIDNRRVTELPLAGRNLAGLAVLTPGVQFGIRGGLGSGDGGFPIPGNSFTVSANGQREINQQITLDGITATDTFANRGVFSPSIDAVEEFRVQTSSYSAEYGQNSGAIVQIVLKSGTNQLRGTVYGFVRNEAFDARDYFLGFEAPPGAPPSKKDRLRRNQFGAFVSGPVLLPKYSGKDRTFWSFNYEGRRSLTEQVSQAFYFPDSFRRGDFSALLTPLIRNGRPVRAPIIIWDPRTGEPFQDGSGNITNIIPPSRINRNAQNYVNTYLPLPKFQPADMLDFNVSGSPADTIDTDQYFFRIDHQFRSQDKVFVRYAGDRSGRVNESLNPNFRTFTKAQVNNLATQWIHLLGPRVLNEFRFGVNKAADQFTNPRTNTDFDLDSLGIGQFRVAVDNNRKLKPYEVGLPATGVVQGDGDTGNGVDDQRTYQFSDNLSMARGKHNFKTGFDFRRLLLDRAGGNLKRGQVACCEGGYNLAGWLMGHPSGSTTAEGSLFTLPRQNRWSAYFLDDWKVSRNWTLNLGLRWDYFESPVDANGTWRVLRLDILNPASDGRRLPTFSPAPYTANYSMYQKENRFFMPRIGLAYRVTDRWVIRAAGGWFANAQHLNNYTILAFAPPRSGSYGFQQVTDVARTIRYEYGGQTYNLQTRRFRPGTQILTLDNLFPGAGTTAARENLIVLPPDNKNSDHVQWSLDLQRSLPWDTSLTVAYVGSKTSHLDNNITNFNSPDPSPDTNVDARRPWQAFVSEGEGNRPRLLGTIRYLDSYGNGSYHGLQTSVEKRYSHGLILGLAYTFSKSMGEGYGRNESGAGVAGGYQNPRDRRASRSRYGFDVTHNAVINYVYEMPFLNRFQGPLGAVLAGWQTNGIITLRTGFPFNVFGGGLNVGSGAAGGGANAGARPDRVADGRLGSQATRARWYDPTAFRRTECNNASRPDLCHYGNAAAGILNTPGLRNLDLSLFKNWKLPPFGESGRLQFRAEFFNASNTPQFGQPGGISWTSIGAVIPDGPRDAEIRSLRQPMRIIQFGLKVYF